MSTQIGAPVRIVALVGVLLALAVGAWTFLAGRTTTSSTSSHAVAAARSAVAKANARTHATTHAARAANRPAVTHVRPAKPAVRADGTPTTIASVLRHHRVAVVLLYDPHAKVDAVSVGEAQLGARRAKAGFLRVNVLKQRQAEPFAKTYGVLHVPTVLFFARPGKLVQKFVGFADQDSVAQAALNAARGLVVTQG